MFVSAETHRDDMSYEDLVKLRVVSHQHITCRLHHVLTQSKKCVCVCVMPSGAAVGVQSRLHSGDGSVSEGQRLGGRHPA